LKPLDFEALGALHFKPLNRKDFPCYDLALKSMELGDNYPCAMNGAGEVAVHAFLRGEIPFLAIADVMGYALEKTSRASAVALPVLLETDGVARAYANEYIKNK
jgi:1-deoxy-D-xylulose-5-phosphate reductoisomerase